MNYQALNWTGCCIALLGMEMAGATLAFAGDRGPPALPPVHYTGLLNDYTPSAGVVKNGPYEIRGKWSLDVDSRHGTARFSAAVNMETSDYGISETTTNAQGATVPLVNKDDPTTRGAHTHHIVMTDGVISSDWATVCPKFSPAAAAGFVVTGSVFITGNGSPAPFGNPSPVTLCVLGGPNVAYSNFTMTFGIPASSHFGTFAIHGVVLNCASIWEFSSKDCQVQQPD